MPSRYTTTRFVVATYQPELQKQPRGASSVGLGKIVLVVLQL